MKHFLNVHNDSSCCMEDYMKIQITKVFTENAKKIVVEFSSLVGECKAIWMGGKPSLGNIYDVEIDVESKLTWGEDILLSNSETYQINCTNNYISLVGKLVAVEEDNSAAMQIENDIILLETFGSPFKEGSFVEIITNEILVYDTAI